MKNLLSLESDFNIFNLLGIFIFIFLGYNYHTSLPSPKVYIPTIFFATLVSNFPYIYKSLVAYKSSKQIKTVIISIALTIMQALVIIAITKTFL